MVTRKFEARGGRSASAACSTAVGLGYAAELWHFATGAVECEVMGCLQIEPEFRCGIESLGEKPGSFRSDAALATHKLINSLDRYAQVLRECHLSLTERNQEFLS